MNYQHKRRFEGETKKEFYQRLAAMKKKERSYLHKKQQKLEQGIKKQFEEERQSIKLITDLKSQKIKPIKKSNYKQEQKLRNRVAAQQSRHRHRQYVEELQNKIKIYQQLLQQNGLICKNCSKSLLNDNQDTESLINAHNVNELSSKQDANQKTILLKSQEQQIILQEYLQEQIIRIDNTGATSPFAIFFAVFLLGIFAFLIISPENRNQIYHTNPNSLLVHFSGIQSPDNQEIFKNEIKDENYGEIKHIVSKDRGQQISQESKQNLKTIFENKVGMVCNSSLVLNYPTSQPGVPQMPLQFYILFNKSDNKPKLQIEAPTTSNTEGESYKILAHQSQKVEISTCFTF